MKPVLRRHLIHASLGALAAALTAFSVLIFLDAFVMPNLTRQGAALLDVPQVRGLEPSAAEIQLRQSGLRMVVDPEARFAEDLEAGRVAWQRPGPESRVKEGFPVRVWLSTPHRQSQVPNLSGVSQERAIVLLRRARLLADPSVEWIPDSVDAGTVLTTRPGAGAMVPEESKVILVLSGGRSDDTLNVLPPADGGDNEQTPTRRVF